MKKYLLLSLLASIACFGESISLQKACELAVENEPSLKSYSLQVAALSEDITQAKSRFLPQIEATATYLDRKSLVNLSKKYEAEKYDSYSINLKQSIYHPEYYAGFQKSKYRFQAEKYGLEYEKQDLMTRAAEAYLNVLKAQNTVEVAKFYIESNGANFKQLEKMYELEMADKMKYLQAKVDFENAKIEYANQTNNLNNAIMAFKFITGGNYAPLEINDAHKTVQNFENIENIENNFKIKQTNSYADVAKSEVKNALYQHFPKIDVSVSYTDFNPNNSNVTDYQNDKSIRAELRLPIYNGGAMDSYHQKTKILYSASLQDIEGTKHKETIAFHEAKMKYEAALASIKNYNEAYESAQLYLHAISQGFEKGLKSKVELEDAKSKLAEIKFKRNNNFYDYLLNYIKVLKISGNLSLDKIINYK